MTQKKRKRYSEWLNTYERFLNYFDELATQIDEKDKSEMFADQMQKWSASECIIMHVPLGGDTTLKGLCAGAQQGNLTSTSR